MSKGRKRKGAKILSKYAASRLKRSRRLSIAIQRTGVLGWFSFKSPQSILSAFSYSSILSFGSIRSIGSTASILSIGSIGSILSIGSAGSILSIGSVGSILSIGSAGAAPRRDPSEIEAELHPESPPPPGSLAPEPPPQQPPLGAIPP